MSTDTIPMQILTEQDMIRLRFQLHPEDVEDITMVTKPDGQARVITQMKDKYGNMNRTMWGNTPR